MTFIHNTYDVSSQSNANDRTHSATMIAVSIVPKGPAFIPLAAWGSRCFHTDHQGWLAKASKQEIQGENKYQRQKRYN